MGITSTPLLVALVAVFIGVAVVMAATVGTVLQRATPERRRLRRLIRPSEVGTVVAEDKSLVANDAAQIKRARTFVPRSPAQISLTRRRLMRAGYRNVSAVIVYFWSELTLPVVLGLASLWIFGWSQGWMIVIFMAILGYLIPGVVLGRLIERRKTQLQNGLPDALDLMIVCVEAGSSLDQAVLKTSDDLVVSHPALADEFKTLNVETRAGKPRIEAFKNLASRTGLDDVRALVSMLTQTDRFGTSIAQALRTHAQTLRAKRRQRAEERAAKVGVKLVFPLVFFLFPAFYVVTLGPAIIQFVRVFFGEVVQ